MAINKGLALVSVADVLFFDPVTDVYIGEGLALTDSTLTQEVQSIEHRGGYLNALLFDIKHSKTVTVELTSATFRMEYLAFQTGTQIANGLSSVYEFGDCISFTNGVGTTEKEPVGTVYVRMPNGNVQGFTPTGNSVNIGMGTFSGELQAVYKYNHENVTQLTIDTQSQPLVVKAVMRVHALNQDGREGYLELTIPRLKFNGNITLTLTADAVSTFGIGGTAQEVTDNCGESYYVDVKYISLDDTENIPVQAIVASPNTYKFSLAGTHTATANIIGVRNLPYSNVTLANADVTFNSADNGKVSVTEDGLITGVAETDGSPVAITVTYEGLQDTINVTVGA